MVCTVARYLLESSAEAARKGAKTETCEGYAGQGNIETRIKCRITDAKLFL